MSLNGLDDTKVKEAHDAAVAEPGGWFLLKYVSRDEIELMSRGNGGIVEIRNAIGQYEEPSPLFGFIRYRRRNVVIKYVPEGCSRLVQARVTVHFNAVAEKFGSHDTTFEITDAKELRDTTLSAACSLHTASGSVSSSTSSLRRRRLMEIAEDEEEDSKINRQSTVQEERPPTAQTTGSAIETEPIAGPTTSPLELPNSNSITFSSMVPEADNTLETSPPRPRGPLGLDLDTSPPPPRETREVEVASPIPTIEEEPRKSSQSARPDLYSLSSYASTGKRKIKLGPRPSLDVGKTHSSGGTSIYRPISTLPQGLKIFSSKGSKKERGRLNSQDSGEPPSMSLLTPPIPEIGALPTFFPSRPQISGRPNTSSGVSVRSTVSTKSTATTKTPSMTPEKARLMKAMELRKKQMSAPLVSTPLKSSSVENFTVSTPTDPKKSLGAPQEIQDALAMLSDMARAKKADDSAIALDSSSMLKTDESDATRADSSPVSPIGASEKAESTTPSSISESTDETVQDLYISKTTSTGMDTMENTTQQHESEAASTAMNDVEQPTPQFESENAEAHPTNQDTNEVIVNNVPTSQPSIVIEETIISQPVDESAVGQTISDEESKEDGPTPHSKPAAGQVSPIVENGVPISLSASNIEPSNTDEVKLESQAVVKSASEPLLKNPFEESQTLSVRKKRSRKSVDPIHTDFDADHSGANSDDNFSSDDELMDELQSAVFQDAKPVSVAKSPISPAFPRPTTSDNKSSRTVSNPLQAIRPSPPLLTAQPGGARPPSRPASASANFLNRLSMLPGQLPTAQPVVAKKINVGSGVSQRIKALERLSTLAPEAAATATTTGPSPTASPAFFNVRKNSALPARTLSVAERTNSLASKMPSPSVSREASPELSRGRDRSSSIQQRVDALKPSTSLSEVKTSPSHLESVSVTARIVRDPNQPYPQRPEVGKDPSDYAPLALKESPLIIDHQKASTSPPKETLLERRMSTSSKNTNTPGKDRRSSITVVKDLINDRRSSFAERRRSTTFELSTSDPSLMSPSKPPSTHITSPGKSRPLSISSRSNSRDNLSELSPPPTARSSSSMNDDRPDKKSNRTSRMIKRMSNSLSSSRKAIAHAISPTVREDPEPPVFPEQGISSIPSQISVLASPTIASDLGDVNVQFPDSLLWKRRSMVIDSQGLLIITASGNTKEKGGATRRFHLSEFRAPNIPDIDMQELPNSIVLGFVDGGELQIACEDRSGQRHTLNVLQDSYGQWVTGNK